jgi:hypothetical protein
MNATTIQFNTDFYLIPDREHPIYRPIYLCRLAFTPILCNAHSKKIFVFGDNVERSGKGGQAIIRDCENSVGIRTKKEPKTFAGSFFTDRDYIWFKKLIDHDIKNIYDLNKESEIVFSINGYGTGKAELYTRAPKCFNYLCREINTFCGQTIFNPNYGQDTLHNSL